MGLSGCYSVIKCLLVVVNCIFGIVGILTVSLASWMFFDPTLYISMTQDANNFLISTCILFIAGALLIIVFFLGCLGTFRESKCMLFTFFSILLVVLVAEIAAGVWGYLNANSLEKIVRDSVRQTVHEEYHKIESRRLTFDAIQKGLECCGADKANDWLGENSQVVLSVSSNPVEYNIPTSCCRAGIDENTCKDATRDIRAGGKINYKIISEEGCYQKLLDTVKEYAHVIFGVGIAIIVIELLGLIFSLVLAFAINKSGRYKA